MREALDRERLRRFMDRLARSAPSDVPVRVYFIGGATAIDRGWRDSTIDVDLYASDDRLFVDIQRIKEELNINVERVRPEDFVPRLRGSDARHLFIRSSGTVSFFHYDPYAQFFAKVVRGFRQDLEDAGRFLDDGLVDADLIRDLVRSVPDEAYARYPSLSRAAVDGAIDGFLTDRG